MILPIVFLAETASSIPPPADWTSLPQIELGSSSAVTSRVTLNVIELVKIARCDPPWIKLGWRGYRVPLVILVAPDGSILEVGAVGIGCESVENYAASLVWKKLKPNPFSESGPRWFKISITFSWQS